MFGRLFEKKQPAKPRTSNFIVARLNARIQPVHRGEFFEDPLDEELQRYSFGKVSGGGTMLMQSGEIEYCDIEIDAARPPDEIVDRVVEILERLGAPKGSKLTIEADGREIPFGRSEGMAVYLNGTDLPDEVYKKCDSNFVYSEFDRLIAGEGRVFSYWQGPTETAFYLYGSSFAVMRSRISSFLSSYPLCQKSRVEQVA